MGTTNSSDFLKKLDFIVQIDHLEQTNQTNTRPRTLKLFCFGPRFNGEGGTMYSNVFFCSVNFVRSLYSSLIDIGGIIRKHPHPRIWN